MNLSQSGSERTSQGIWQQIPFKVDLDFKPQGYKSVIVDQYLVMIGPLSAYGCAILIAFDMDGETCSKVKFSGKEMPDILPNYSACYWKDRQIIVYGSKRGPFFSYTSTVAIITLSNTEPLTAQWRTIKTGSDIARGGHTAHIYKDQMIVLGGRNEPDMPSQAIHSLNLNDFTWKELEKAKDPQKLGCFNKNVLYGNKIYVLAEMENENKFTFRSLDLVSSAWKQLPLDIVYSDCDFAAIQEFKGKIYLVHGTNSHQRLTLKCFDIDEEKWSLDQLKDQDLFAAKNSSIYLNAYGNELILHGQIKSTPEQESTDFCLFKITSIADLSVNGMTQDMKAFLKEAPNADIIFEVESEQIPAHKWWLCRKSNYFINMFKSGMSETNNSKIVISDMSAATFRAFLEYLYSDDIKLGVTLAKDLLTVADKYIVPQLRKLCEEFLIKKISADNYLDLANLSELVDANKLRDAVIDYIAKNRRTLRSREDFEKLSQKMLADVISKI